MESIVTLLGRFHPLIVHLPIGILLLLAAIEAVSWFPRFPQIPRAVRNVILVLGAVSAAFAVLFGWWLARSGEYDATLLFRHRVLGVAAAALALALLGLHLLRWRKAYTAAWIATVVVLSAAGHYGGVLTHGSDYLAFGSVKKPAAKDIAQVGMFDDVIHPILRQRCFACHGPTKSNGDLRYDTWEALMKGGKDGPSFKAGDAAASHMIQRAHLPLEAKEHMPPKGKPQLTDDELELLEWWIDSGASRELKLASAELPVHLTEILAERFPGLLPPVPDRAVSLAHATELERKLGAAIRPLAAEGPWFSVNARLTGPQFGDAQLEALAPVALAISSLDLGETSVTDAGLRVITSMQNLRRLSLDRTGITDAGLQSLSGLKRLEYLNVHTTAITDAGLAALKPLKQLRSLYLWQTKVTPAAAEELGSQLVDHRRIRRLEEQAADLQNAIRRQQFNANLGITTNTKPDAAAKPIGTMKIGDAKPAARTAVPPPP